MFRRHQPTSPFRIFALGTALLLMLSPAAIAAIPATIHIDGPGDVEGDPIDSNDFGGGGGGGGSHDDIHDSYAVAPVVPRYPVVVLDRWTILLVPDTRLGLSVFSFMILDAGVIVGEAGHAR